MLPKLQIGDNTYHDEEFMISIDSNNISTLKTAIYTYYLTQDLQFRTNAAQPCRVLELRVRTTGSSQTKVLVFPEQKITKQQQ